MVTVRKIAFILLFATLLLTLPENVRSSSLSTLQQELTVLQIRDRERKARVEEAVNQRFGIHYQKLNQRFSSQLDELNAKQAMLERIENPKERQAKQHALGAEIDDEAFYRYLEAYSYFENELESDHQWVAQLLTELTNILDRLIQEDPLLHAAFEGSEFRAQFGSVLKRVVWNDTQLGKVSAETTPLNVQAIFADKQKLPMLIKFTPRAFDSIAFLRSIALHELEHVLFYKDPRFADTRIFEGSALKPARGPFAHYFARMNPTAPHYQYHLVQEYYAFELQLRFDQRMAGKPGYALSPTQRQRIQNMRDWAYSQLNDSNQAFVQQHPDPPLLEWILRFYPRTQPQPKPAKRR